MRYAVDVGNIICLPKVSPDAGVVINYLMFDAKVSLTMELLDPDTNKLVVKTIIVKGLIVKGIEDSLSVKIVDKLRGSEGDLLGILNALFNWSFGTAIGRKLSFLVLSDDPLLDTNRIILTLGGRWSAEAIPVTRLEVLPSYNLVDVYFSLFKDLTVLEFLGLVWLRYGDPGDTIHVFEKGKYKGLERIPRITEEHFENLKERLNLELNT